MAKNTRRYSNSKETFKHYPIGAIIAESITTLVTFFLLNYLTLPVVGWSFGMLAIITLSLAVGYFAGKIAELFYDDYLVEDYSHKILGIGVLVFLACIIISLIASWTLFHVDAAKFRINLETISQEELCEMLPSVDDKDAYSWADSNTAKKLAARKTGELTELVSLYTTSNNVTTTIDNNSITKYIPLKYSGFWKWTAADNIPGYIQVDPVTLDSNYVNKPFKYSPSAYFGEYMTRRLRNEYPTEYLGAHSFQIDPEGNPCWVVELERLKSSWFIKETHAICIMDANTGKCVKYELNAVPEWVTAISSQTAMNYYNSYGRLINGYINFSKVGETTTTDDYGYVNINNTLYYYTGVTSAVNDGGDESNLGVLLYNAYTNKALYCQIAGAEEHSAMEAAQGIVQNYGYEAAFPSLVMVNGEMTYTMVLKDANGLVKQYAMVNYCDYNMAAVGDTLAACKAKYIKMLNSNGSVQDNETAEKKTVTVEDVLYVNQNSDTMVYIRCTDGSVYKSIFDEAFLFVKSGDVIEIVVTTDEKVPTIFLKN